MSDINGVFLAKTTPFILFFRLVLNNEKFYGAITCFLFILLTNNLFSDIIYDVLGDEMEQLISIIALILASLFCIITHEIAHGYVALLNGDSTAKVNGRLSFNPAKHFDLIGFLMFILVRFGYAKPVPINPYYFKKRKLGLITVSLAGVIVNLITSFIFFLFLVLVNKFCAPLIYQSNAGYYFFYFLKSLTSYVVLVGVNLALFNLLPLHPLDGYNLLEGIFGADHRVIKFLRDFGKYLLLGLILLSVLVNSVNLPSYFSPLFWYIDTVGGFILDLFGKFWSLFF